MKHIMTILTGLVIVASCVNRTEQEGKRELVPNPEKYVHDGYLTLEDSLKPVFIPDTSIGKISLLNTANIDEYLGQNSMGRLSELGDGEGLAHLEVLSDDKNQRLTVFFHPGGAKKEYSEFKVSYNESKNRNVFVTDNTEFITESGIKLGMTMGEFRSIKGEPDTIINDEVTTFHYRIDNFNKSEFLKRYSMPVYFADHVFKKGYLNEFKFGFEYP